MYDDEDGEVDEDEDKDEEKEPNHERVIFNPGRPTSAWPEHSRGRKRGSGGTVGMIAAGGRGREVPAADAVNQVAHGGPSQQLHRLRSVRVRHKTMVLSALPARAMAAGAAPVLAEMLMEEAVGEGHCARRCMRGIPVAAGLASAVSPAGTHAFLCSCRPVAPSIMACSQCVHCEMLRAL